jgi:hypothetical protein
LSKAEIIGGGNQAGASPRVVHLRVDHFQYGPLPEFEALLRQSEIFFR